MAWNLTAPIPNRFKNGVLLDELAASPSVAVSGPNAVYSKSDHGIYVGNGLEERSLNGNQIGRPSAYGAHSFTCDPSVAINSAGAQGTGRIWCWDMDWHLTRTINFLDYYTHTLGSGFTANRNFWGIYDGETGNRLWLSSDQATNLGSTGLSPLTVSPGITVVPGAHGRIVVAFLAVATTMPILRGNNPGGTLVNYNRTNATGYAAWQDASSGNTTLPATLNVFPTSPGLINNVFVALR